MLLFSVSGSLVDLGEGVNSVTVISVEAVDVAVTIDHCFEIQFVLFIYIVNA